MILCGVGLILLAACTGDELADEAAFAVPTRTLVPPTATPTSVPSSLLTPTPTDLPAPSALEPEATAITVLEVPPAVRDLLDQTTRDLVAQSHVDPQDIRLLSVEAFIWRDQTWGCSARHPGGQPEPVTTPGYRIVFSAGSRTYVYHTDQEGHFFLCDDRAWLAMEGEPVVFDPIAQAMVELSLRDAARRLNKPEAEIKLVSLLTLTWPDSSVGCPKPGADYADDLTPGYRIVFRSGDQAIIYHTNDRNIVHCTPEEEILPGILRQALPTPTAVPE
jgi:hypothetical protein